jgi:hypothetical protein
VFGRFPLSGPVKLGGSGAPHVRASLLWPPQWAALPNAGRPPIQSGERRCGAERDNDDYDNLIPHGMRVAQAASVGGLFHFRCTDIDTNAQSSLVGSVSVETSSGARELLRRRLKFANPCLFEKLIRPIEDVISQLGIVIIASFIGQCQ